jgi:O-antigen ligase
MVVYFPSAAEWRFFLRGIFPIAFMFLFGLVFCNGNATYVILKDTFYLWKLPVCVMLGLIIGRGISHDRLLSFYFKCSIVFSLVFLARYAVFGVSDETNEFARVADSGGVPYFTCLALPILLGSLLEKHDLHVSIPTSVSVGVLLTVTAISVSRTYVVSTIIGLFVFANLKSKVVMLAAGGVAALSMIAVGEQQQSQFLYKIFNSLQEMSFVGSLDLTDVTTNWRGFEATMAWDQFLSVSFVEQWIGQGLGTVVNLGGVYYLGEDMVYSAIPILHNGYFQILTKYGVVGVVLYLFFFITLFRSSLTAKGEESFMRRKIAYSFVIITVFTTGIIAGLFNKFVMDPLFVFVVATMTSLRTSGIDRDSLHPAR